MNSKTQPKQGQVKSLSFKPSHALDPDADEWTPRRGSFSKPVKRDILPKLQEHPDGQNATDVVLTTDNLSQIDKSHEISAGKNPSVSLSNDQALVSKPTSSDLSANTTVELLVAHCSMTLPDDKSQTPKTIQGESDRTLDSRWANKMFVRIIAIGDCQIVNNGVFEPIGKTYPEGVKEGYLPVQDWTISNTWSTEQGPTSASEQMMDKLSHRNSDDKSYHPCNNHTSTRYSPKYSGHQFKLMSEVESRKRGTKTEKASNDYPKADSRQKTPGHNEGSKQASSKRYRGHHETQVTARSNEILYPSHQPLSALVPDSQDESMLESELPKLPAFQRGNRPDVSQNWSQSRQSIDLKRGDTQQIIPQQIALQSMSHDNCAQKTSASTSNLAKQQSWPSEISNTAGLQDSLEGLSKSSAVSTPASRLVKAQQRLRRSFDCLEAHPHTSSNHDNGHFDNLNKLHWVPASQEGVLVKLLDGSVQNLSTAFPVPQKVTVETQHNRSNIATSLTSCPPGFKDQICTTMLPVKAPYKAVTPSTLPYSQVNFTLDYFHVCTHCDAAVIYWHWHQADDDMISTEMYQSR